MSLFYVTCIKISFHLYLLLKTLNKSLVKINYSIDSSLLRNKTNAHPFNVKVIE